MSDAPTIVTKRLTLRQIRRSDAADVFEHASHPQMLRFTTGVTPKSIEDTKQFVDSLLKKPEDAYAWAILVEGSPKVDGIIEFGLRDDVGTVDYGLAVPQWNRGYMTEAVRAVIEWAFGHHPELKVIAASAMTENKASISVMEKSGMEFQEVWFDHWRKFAEPVELTILNNPARQTCIGLPRPSTCTFPRASGILNGPLEPPIADPA